MTVDASRPRVVPITVAANDSTPLDGTFYEPADPRPCGVIVTHGVGSDHRGGVAGWLGAALAPLGFTVLALDRRDRGTGPVTATFDDGLADIAVAVDEMRRRGIERIVLCGHSKGTVYLPVFESARSERDIVGLALFATMHDNHAVARDVLWPETFPELLLEAEQRLERGNSEPFDPGGGLLISPSAFVSLFGPDTSAAPARTIADVSVPTWCCRVAEDSLAPASFQSSVVDAGLAAGVAITGVTMSSTSSTPVDAHRFVDVKDETARRFVQWIEHTVMTDNRER